MNKKCKNCKITFISKRKDKIFCCKRCSQVFRISKIKLDPILYQRFKWLDNRRKHQYRFGMTEIKEVFNRFDGKCKSCGVKAQVIHHIDGNGNPKDKATLNNNIDNLIPLCRSCHARLHMEQGDSGLNK